MQSLNKSIKKFDIQNVSFSEILLVILFILLIFNYQSLEKLDLKKEDYQELYKEKLDLENQIKEKNNIIFSQKQEIKRLERKIVVLLKVVDPAKLPLYVPEIIDAGLGTELFGEECEEGDLECEKTKEPTGSGKPNCAKDKFKYVVNIIAYPAGFKVLPKWNESKDKDFINSVDGMRGLVGKNFLPNNEFRKLGNKILKWSKRQNTECRFLAEFDDRNLANSSAKILKKQKILAEGPFYLYWLYQ